MPEEINRLFDRPDRGSAADPVDGRLTRICGPKAIPDERIRFVGNVMIDSLFHQLETGRIVESSGRSGHRRNGLRPR